MSMSRCVPNWELDNGLPHPPRIQPSTSTTTNSKHTHISDYVASELTWANGPLPSNGSRETPRRVRRPVPKRMSPTTTTWEKPLVSGTLEAVVDQATRAPPALLDHPAADAGHRSPRSTGCHLVPWLGSPLLPAPAAVDALVPSADSHPYDGKELRPSSYLVRVSAASNADGGGGGTCVGSCSGRKRARLGAGDGSVSVNAAHSAGSVGLTFDTRETNGGGGEEEDFTTSASLLDGSPETVNNSCGRPPMTVSEDDEDSGDGRRSQEGSDEEERSKNGKRASSVSTNRSRAAAVHNQSERKRRDRINQRMRTLQKLLPNSNKTDKASILDEVIGYTKQLQAQLQVMSRMGTALPHMMMMPMAMQQLQMSMMAQVAQMAQMGMPMPMGALGGGGQAGTPWPAFLPPSGDVCAQAPGGAFLQDPSAAFMACQTPQPLAMDAYRRMAALYQQLYQQPPASSHNNT